MADAAGLGPVGGDTVGVQVPSPALSDTAVALHVGFLATPSLPRKADASYSRDQQPAERPHPAPLRPASRAAPAPPCRPHAASPPSRLAHAVSPAPPSRPYPSARAAVSPVPARPRRRLARTRLA